jgi:hypothetical protein
MRAQVWRPFSLLSVCLLALTALIAPAAAAAPGAQAAPSAPVQPVAVVPEQAAPDGLLEALLAATGRTAASPLASDSLLYTEQKVIASGEAQDWFGYSVALDGDTALVGARLDDVAGNADQGSAYVFVRSGTTWTQQAELTASDAAGGDRFGSSVAISGDSAIVGSPYNATPAGAVRAGSAYIFVRSGTAWAQQAELTASAAAANAYFGWSVAISDAAGGATAIVGAQYDDTAGGTDAGSAWVWAVPPSPPG